HQLVQRIHDSPPRIVLVTAGAGTHALSWLLGVPGASRTMLEALVPYDEAASIDFLGQPAQQYVSDTTARLMAGRALTRARLLRHEEETVIGLACTAAIVSDRPKRGQHRAHITTWQNERVTSYHLIIDKGRRDREGEESLVSKLMLNALATAYGLEDQLDLGLGPADTLTIEVSDLEASARSLHDSEIGFFGVDGTGHIRIDDNVPPLLLSGSFHPLHDGHLELGRVASEMMGQPIAFELSAHNVDKPPLPIPVILDRVAQFAGRWPIYASDAPTFIGKARLYPGTTFVIGFDTAVRVPMAKYYDNSEQKMLASLAEIRELGCHFLVAGRADKDGHFQDASELAVPDHLRDLFIAIPQDRFRRDISSTELRQAGKRGSR
ncbi:MAG: hypothetical protein KDE59_32105, partial [Anaerolineales bacterium]|nr:hypothetical protein [Anaerolineales bacterium]